MKLKSHSSAYSLAILPEGSHTSSTPPHCRLEHKVSLGSPEIHHCTADEQSISYGEKTVPPPTLTFLATYIQKTYPQSMSWKKQGRMWDFVEIFIYIGRGGKKVPDKYTGMLNSFI